MKVSTYMRTVDNMKGSRVTVPEGNNNNQLQLANGELASVDLVNRTLNMTEFDTELKLLRQHLADEKVRRETQNQENTQLIAQVQQAFHGREAQLLQQIKQSRELSMEQLVGLGEEKVSAEQRFK